MQAAGKFIVSVRTVFWLAALSCALVPSAVQAGSTNLPSHGGSTTAGSSFTLDCGDDFVLVGVRARKGWWLDRITGLCMRLSRDRRWVGTMTATESAGGTGGDEVTVTCPRDTAVRALRGRFGSYVNRLTLRCRPLVASASAATIRVEGSQAGDHSWSYRWCPNNKFARGFYGRAGDYIDRAGLICHADATPNLQAAPNNIVAVNVVGPQGPSTTAPTPFVQAQWTDRSTAETGYRIYIASLSSNFRRTIDRPAAAGLSSVQAAIISDLPSGQYGLNVCARFGAGLTAAAELCPPGQRVFQIAAGRGAPTNLSVEPFGVGTRRVRWSHNFDNPSRFDVMARCGDSPLGPVASTLDGTARDETFNVGVGPGQVQVCAQYTQPNQNFCSALFAFQCN